MTVIAVSPVFQFFTDSGLPLVGGFVQTYLTGTTTPTPTWQDQAGLSLNTNPIVLNGRGEARIWLDPAITYTFALFDASMALIQVVDNIGGALAASDLANTTNVALGDAMVGVKAPFANSYGTNQHEVNARECWVEDFKDPAISDWSGAFFAAFAAMIATGGGLVRAGRGTFRLDSTVTVTGSGLAFKGQGEGATILQINQNTGPLFFFNTSGQSRSDFAFTDCTLQHVTAMTAPAWPAIVATDVIGLTIERLSIIGTRGIQIAGCTDWAVRGVSMTSLAAVATGVRIVHTLSGTVSLLCNNGVIADITAISGIFDAVTRIEAVEGLLVQNAVHRGGTVGFFINFVASATGGVTIRDVLITGCKNPFGTAGASQGIRSTAAGNAMRDIRIIGNTINGQPALSLTAPAIDSIVVTNNTLRSNGGVNLDFGGVCTNLRYWNNDDSVLTGLLTGFTNSVTNRVQMQPVRFKAFRNTSAQIIAAVVATKIQLNGESFDPFSTFDSVTNFRWTPGVVGTVSLRAGAVVTMPAAAGATFSISIFKNGVTEIARGNQMPTTASTNVGSVVTIEDECIAADFYEVFLLADAVGNKSVFNGASATYFSGFVVQ